MFLQCTALARPVALNQQSSKIDVHNNPINIFKNDQTVFSDFFIRKHPSIAPCDSDQNQMRTNAMYQNELQKRIYHELNHELNERKRAKQKEGLVFTVPKKAFEIKFISSSTKNPFNPNILKRKQLNKKKVQNELIYQRKFRQNKPYTPMSSARYQNQDQSTYLHVFQQNPQTSFSHRKSLQLTSSKNLDERSPHMIKQRPSLTSSYKIKSMILGRNPKSEIVNKSKKLMRTFFQKNNNKQIVLTSRAFSQRPLDVQLNTYFQTARLNTESKNKNEIQLPSTGKNYSSRSVKLDSIFDSNQDEHQVKQVTIQPWIKNNQSDHFQDNIHQIDIALGQKRQQESQKIVQSTSIPRQQAARNSFRRMYATGDGKREKMPIVSQK